MHISSSSQRNKLIVEGDCALKTVLNKRGFMRKFLLQSGWVSLLIGTGILGFQSWGKARIGFKRRTAKNIKGTFCFA